MNHFYHPVSARMLLLLVYVADVTGFLLTTGSCMAPSPCTCSGSTVNCNSKSLLTVPKFTKYNTTDRTSSFTIQLYSNQLTSVPGHAFENISTVNASSIYINLYYNHISSIDLNAFAGIENTTYSLDLHNNNLTTVPAAIGKLRKLNTLNLQGNPIRTFDPTLTSFLAVSLHTLELDMSSFPSWPYAIGNLKRLSTLVINEIPFNHLTLNAFDGLESSLTSLTMSYSKLLRIPSAICHLHNLQSFTFDSNAMLETNFSLFEPCQHRLTRLTSLSLQYDNFRSFPDVLHSFPSLTNLEISHNLIKYIPSKLIPYKNVLQSIQMGNNQLTRIPYALNKAKHVNQLNFQGNQISTVEENDLTSLANLQWLRLYQNPVEYIAPRAFRNNSLINYLDMENTQTKTIPEAVRSLPKLTSFDFSKNNVKCDCNLSHLKGWNVTRISIFGDCAGQTSIKIKQYILASLPKCP